MNGNKGQVTNWYNYNPQGPRCAEVPRGVSLTVPEMTLSLRELLERYTRGGQVATFTPVFLGDEDLPDVTRMDPMQLLDYKRDVQEYIEEKRRGLQNRQAPLPAVPPEPGPSGDNPTETP